MPVRDEDNPGPTGEFPQGHLNPEDEGELKIKVSCKEGKVMIEFSKSITWLGSGKQEALQFAEAVKSCAEYL